MDDFCVKCKTRPIIIRKWKLCRQCYSGLYQVGKLAVKRHGTTIANSISVQTKLSNENELNFIKNFFKHTNWIFHPAIFKSDGFHYEPDFYDGERNMFIEVSGTRQAFHANKEKYKDFQRIFPRINFEIRQVNGDLVNLDAEIYHIPNNSQK